MFITFGAEKRDDKSSFDKKTRVGIACIILLDETFELTPIFYLDKIDNDLNTSRNVSSNKITHAILALVFLTKSFNPV